MNMGEWKESPLPIVFQYDEKTEYSLDIVTKEWTARVLIN